MYVPVMLTDFWCV